MIARKYQGCNVLQSGSEVRLNVAEVTGMGSMTGTVFERSFCIFRQIGANISEERELQSSSGHTLKRVREGSSAQPAEYLV